MFHAMTMGDLANHQAFTRELVVIGGRVTCRVTAWVSRPSPRQRPPHRCGSKPDSCISWRSDGDTSFADRLINLVSGSGLQALGAEAAQR